MSALGIIAVVVGGLVALYGLLVVTWLAVAWHLWSTGQVSLNEPIGETIWGKEWWRGKLRHRNRLEHPAGRPRRDPRVRPVELPAEKAA